MKALQITGAALLVLGTVVLVGGVAWGALFIGVPYPDATPAQAAEEAFHFRISSALMMVGALSMAGSLVVLLVLLVAWVAQRVRAKAL